MNIQEIKNHFLDSEIRDGDMGKYAEIRVQTSLYINVYEAPPCKTYISILIYKAS